MPKDDATWLNVAYVGFALLVAYFTYNALEMLGIQMAWMERYDWYSLVSTLGAVAVAAIAALWLRSSPERHEYFLASIGELRKVSWPSWPDVKKMTLVVVVVVGVFAVILGLFDVVWARALRLLLA